MIKDEIPRGQLSTIILLTLQDKDKYGYEIIDEVLKKTYGRVSIKQPSLYSSLKRMEEQRLISSYWRESEIGGKRHYYHLTDLGKKHLDKWKTDLPDIYVNSINENPHTRVLQQENLFNLTKKELEHVVQQNENKEKDSFVQFDLFTDSTIVTPPSFDDESTNSLDNQNSNNFEDSKTDFIKTKEQNPIITEYEKPLESKTSDFTYIKKINKSFSDIVKEKDESYKKKYVETILDTSEINTKPKEFEPIKSNFDNNPKIDIKSLKNYTANANSYAENNKTEIDEKDDNFTNSKTSIKDDALNANLKLNEDDSVNYKIQPETQDLNENLENNSDNNLNVADKFNEEITNTDLLANTTILSEANEEHIVEVTSNDKLKDDGVIITERLDIKDLPKPSKWDNIRRFDVYVDPSAMPKLTKPNKISNYEDRVKDLYEQSKNSSENHNFELLDNKTKFGNYKNLQQFYGEQNIKFKPFVKSLKTTDKDYSMIRINKLKMFSSLSMFIIFSVLSIILKLCYNKVQGVYLNTTLTYFVLPIAFLLMFIYYFIIYIKAPQKRISLNTNKYNFNLKNLLITMLIIPATLAINLLFGFNFTNFEHYSLSIIYPSLSSLIYLFNYIVIKILLKTKKF